MKKMKSLAVITTIAILLMVINGCKDCNDENPRARVINNGTKEISVQIKTSGGNTENINNIPKGTSSEYRSFARGYTVFTISVGNDSYETAFQMNECFEYDISIDANNQITTMPRDRND